MLRCSSGSFQPDHSDEDRLPVVSHLTICSCSSSRIELGDVTPHNIKQLKRLNQVIFPVSYNDKFYKDVLEVGELAKLGKKHHSCIPLLSNLIL